MTPQGLAGADSIVAPIPTVPLQAAVEVRNRFDGRWTAGYVVAQVEADVERFLYRVRRRCGGDPLPGWFAGDEIRAARGP